MTYAGILPDGTELRLPQPVQARLDREEDAPADGFSGVFPLRESAGNVVGIRVYDRNGELCFDGITDKQEESRAGEQLLSLKGRSRAALLLDNEAIPQTYCMPSLSTIFRRHVQPYGFSGFRGGTKIFTGTLTVSKGMSEWQAAAAFCTQYLKVKPRIQDGVFDASGESPQGGIVFGNSGGVPYSALTVQNRYGELFSELWAQGGTENAYLPVFRDKTAAALGVRRRRCLAAGQDAESVLRAARGKSFAVLVDCPGEIPVRLFQSARVTDEDSVAEENLYVSETAYVLGPGGETTRFVLRRRE